MFFSRKAILMLLATTVVGLGITPLTAEASVKKKSSHVASKKNVKHVKATAQSRSRKHARLVTHIRYPQQESASFSSDSRSLALESSAVLVQDQATGTVLYEKNANAVLPIASITKLMTAMVALDANPDLKETLTIGVEDVDLLKGTHSRLSVGHSCQEKKCCVLR